MSLLAGSSLYSGQLRRLFQGTLSREVEIDIKHVIDVPQS